MSNKKMENIFMEKILSIVKQIYFHAEEISLQSVEMRCKMLVEELLLEKKVEIIYKEKKFEEFINNIIADLESNLSFQPTDVLYADMAGKISAYKYIKKNYLEEKS